MYCNGRTWFSKRLSYASLAFSDLSEVSECNDSTDDDDVADGERTRKSKRAGATLDCTDSDLMAHDNHEVTQPPSKASQTLPVHCVQSPTPEATGVVPAVPSTSAVATWQTPSTTLDLCCCPTLCLGETGLDAGIQGKQSKDSHHDHCDVQC
jgi:hypothetical protein